MKLIPLLLAISLAGCATSGKVQSPFPDAPELLMREPNSQLVEIQDNATLSDVTKVVTKNYTTAHEWKAQLKSLQDWILEQKALTDKKVSEIKDLQSR